MDEKNQTGSKTIDERVAEIRLRFAQSETAGHIDADGDTEWQDGGWSAWDKN